MDIINYQNPVVSEIRKNGVSVILKSCLTVIGINDRQLYWLAVLQDFRKLSAEFTLVKCGLDVSCQKVCPVFFHDFQRTRAAFDCCKAFFTLGQLAEPVSQVRCTDPKPGSQFQDVMATQMLDQVSQ